VNVFNTEQTGADFKHQFRMALRFSKKIGSPGIVVDPEAYKNVSILNKYFGNGENKWD
jgi:hypothetical protein